MTEQQQDETWHAKEMRLANQRKQQWLDRRGKIVSWFVEPWPASYWIGSTWAGLMAGLLLGVLIGVSLA